MSATRLCLPAHQWPEVDRARWRCAQASVGFLEDDKPASRWSPSRRRIGEQAYGQWLGFLERCEALDPSCSPGERATEERLRAFILELRARVAPASVGMMIGALLRMLGALEPDRDWTRLARVYNHLKRTAVPSRDKRARIVPAADLFHLGLWLMDTCEEGGPQRYRKAIRYRDGLLIALLVACPMRLKNLAGLVVGRHLVFDGDNYRIELAAAETKSGRPYVADIPSQLTSYVDFYLKCFRCILQSTANYCDIADSTAVHLWLDRSGRPMSGKAIRRQIEVRTGQAFGKHIWPHLFRDCAVTELVDSAPDEIGIAPDLLGHADLAMTRKHYIQAQGMAAHARIQDMIAARRRAAAARGARDA